MELTHICQSLFALPEELALPENLHPLYINRDPRVTLHK